MEGFGSAAMEGSGSAAMEGGGSKWTTYPAQ